METESALKTVGDDIFARFTGPGGRIPVERNWTGWLAGENALIFFVEFVARFALGTNLNRS